MRIIRFAVQRKIKYGVLQDQIVRSLRGSPFSQFKGPGTNYKFDEFSYDIKDVKLLAPCLPSKLVCLGLNYHSHIDEIPEKGGKLPPTPEVPIIFLKPSTSVIGPDEEIILPYLSGRVEYEGELAVVIGKKAKDVTEDRAGQYILGYTCFNDVSERAAQLADSQWTRGKGYDTFAPIGPWIESDIDPDDLKLETYLNGELRQSSSTNALIFNIPKLISFISGVMTLLPGDVIATGTPAGCGPMNIDDVVEVRIEKIGSLKNKVTYHK